MLGLGGAGGQGGCLPPTARVTLRRVSESEVRRKEGVPPRQREQVCVQGPQVGENQVWSSNENEGELGESQGWRGRQVRSWGSPQPWCLEFRHYPESKEMTERFKRESDIAELCILKAVLAAV